MSARERFAVTAVWLGCVAGLAGQAAPPSSAVKSPGQSSAQLAALSPELAAAQGLYADGKFGEAEAAAKKLPDGDKYSVAGLQLRAELELSASNLASAQADLLQARHLDIHNKTTLGLLALAFQRADKFADAAPFLEQVDRIAEARQAQALAATVAYRVDGLGVEDRIKLLRVDPLPVVAVRLNGGAVRYFLVDTGGAELLLDDSLASQLELPDLGATQEKLAGGEIRRLGHSVLPSIAIGLWVVHDVPVVTGSTAAYSQMFDVATDGQPGGAAGAGIDIRGVIGTEFLAHFLSTIDYRKGELRLERRPPVRGAATDAAVMQRMTAAGAAAVPLRYVGDHSLLVDGTVTASGNAVGGTPVLLDTGLEGAGFTAPDSTWKALGVTRDATSVKSIVLQQVRLGAAGQLVQKDVTGLAGGFPPGLENAGGVKVGGVLGHSFFRQYAITFDLGNRTLWVQQ